MSKKILFISSMAFSSQSGGAQCSKRNLDSMIDLFGEENVLTYALKSFDKKSAKLVGMLKTIINTVCLRIHGATKSVEDEIINIILKRKIGLVFIDSSLNGRLIKKIKKDTQAKVVSFFHNCEYYLIMQQVKSGQAWVLPRLYSSFFSEKLTLKYSDISIGLCERDNRFVFKYYKKSFGGIIPMSLKDKVSSFDNPHNNTRNLKNILFVGSLFYPNVHGIKWFIDFVMPHIKATLTIVGKDIDKIGFTESEQVKVRANVPNLTEYYENADVVIAPIFKGAGMKVKVVEAMMFGLNIVATKEAFEGYNIVEGMYEVNSKEEFIAILSEDSVWIKHQAVRDNYLANYSFDVTLNLFKKYLDSVI